MERGTGLCFFLLFSVASLGLARGYDFTVGGRSGWVTSPSESYSSWSGRMRFSVNDSLVFVYDKAVDSVLEVSSADYSSCNAASPLTKLNSGRDTFKLPRSGPFYFISGNASHCQAGQKLMVVVLSIRSPPSSPTPPAPGSSTPPASAPTPASTAAPAPASATPSPATSPASTPSPSGLPSAGPALSPTPSAAPGPSSASPPAPSGGSTGPSPSSDSGPGSAPPSGSAGSPPAPPSGSSATSLSGTSSYQAILAAAALALFSGALLQ